MADAVVANSSADIATCEIPADASLMASALRSGMPAVIRPVTSPVARIPMPAAARNETRRTCIANALRAVACSRVVMTPCCLNSALRDPQLLMGGAIRRRSSAAIETTRR
jgi:hypothetical protein